MPIAAKNCGVNNLANASTSSFFTVPSESYAIDDARSVLFLNNRGKPIGNETLVAENSILADNYPSPSKKLCTERAQLTCRINPTNAPPQMFPMPMDAMNANNFNKSNDNLTTALSFMNGINSINNVSRYIPSGYNASIQGPSSETMIMHPNPEVMLIMGQTRTPKMFVRSKNVLLQSY